MLRRQQRCVSGLKQTLFSSFPLPWWERDQGRGGATLIEKGKGWHVAAALLLAVFLISLAGCATAPSEPEPAPASGDKKTQTEAKEPLPEALTNGFNKGLSELAAKSFDAATRTFLALTETYPDYPAVWANLGLSLEGKGDTDGAKGAYGQALSLNPDQPLALHQLAMLDQKAGSFTAAREKLEQLLAKTPDYTMAHRNLGIICDLYLRDLDCALTHYQAYKNQLTGEDREVELWIADLERRMDSR